MSELVQRLSVGEHEVEVSLRPDRNVDAFKRRLDDGYVHVRFVGTRGGTELGFRLEPGECDVASADFDARTGQVQLAGNLTLDYVPVRCRVTIDLPALTGKGRLEPIQ